ncbi:MAG: ABC transporter ATP-binding protein/permease, partial [Burkholderiales bacterium]|nr:ABC transporter ATP-binding protein/permease [Burkholderiales bacterium]
MSEVAVPLSAPSPPPRTRRGFLRDAWTLTRPYFTSQDRAAAWGLLAAVVALTLAMVWMNVQFNDWNGAFYNALENKDTAKFLPLMGRFGILAAVYIAMAVYAVYL